MMNNQKEQKYLPRDEFEKYIDRLSVDEIIEFLPQEINKHNLITEFNNNKFVIQYKRSRGSGRLLDRTWKRHETMLVSPIISIESKYGCKKMALYLYDNGYLPGYSTLKQVR